MAVSNNPKRQSRISMLIGATEGRPFSYRRILWYLVFLIIILSIGYVSYEGHKKHIDKSRVYGKWTEITGPSYAKDVFYLRVDGVRMDNRYLASSFEFDGEVVSFYSGDIHYEYKLYGDNDERLRKLNGGGYAASFIKEGYEHTIPDPEKVGRARRISVAEHFQELKK